MDQLQDTSGPARILVDQLQDTSECTTLTVKTIFDSRKFAIMDCLASTAASNGVCLAMFLANKGAPLANSNYGQAC